MTTGLRAGLLEVGKVSACCEAGGKADSVDRGVANRGRCATLLFRRFSRRAAVVGFVTAVVLGVGVGLGVAYWTGGGSGSGSANTGTAANVTVIQTVSPTGLYPGGAAALSGNFNNASSGSVFVAAVTASVTAFSARADGAKPACTQADFSITGTASVNAEVAAGNGVGSWSGLSLNMSDAGTNQDNCKSITVPITYAAS